MWAGGLSKHYTVAANANGPGGLTIAPTVQPLSPSLLGAETNISRLSPAFRNPPPVAESPVSQKTNAVAVTPEELLLTTGPKRS